MKWLILLIPLLLVVLLIINIQIKMKFNETKLIVYLFKIPIFKKSGDEIYDFALKMIKDSGKSKININEIIKNISFDKVNIILNTIVNSYQAFVIEKYLINKLNKLLKMQKQIPIEQSYVNIYENSSNHFDINIELHFKLIDIIRGIYG